MSGRSLYTECCLALNTAARCQLHQIFTHSTTRAWLEVKRHFYVLTAVLPFLTIGTSRDSVIFIATRPWVARTGVRNPVRARNLYSPKRSDRLWGQLSLLFIGYRGSFWGAKKPRREVNHTPLSIAEVRNDWSYTSFILIYVHGVERDNVTFLRLFISLQALGFTLTTPFIWPATWHNMSWVVLRN